MITVISWLLALVLLYFGIQKGGVWASFYCFVALALLSFVFGFEISLPSFEIPITILSAIFFSASLQSCGVLSYLSDKLSKVLESVSDLKFFLIVPLIAFFMSVLFGTGHTLYSFLPIIADNAVKKRARPDRVLGLAVIASQQGVVASPLSASTLLSIFYLRDRHIELSHLFIIILPAFLLGLVFACVYFIFENKRKPTVLLSSNYLVKKQKAVRKNNYKSKYVFRGLFILFLSFTLILSSALAPSFFSHYINYFFSIQLNQGSLVPFVMIFSSFILVISNHINFRLICSQDICKAGFPAVLMILSTAWLGQTLMNHTLKEISHIPQVIEIIANPFVLCFFTLCASILLCSQAATVNLFMPLALACSVPTWIVFACLSGVSAYFILPTYPTMIAAEKVDKTGMTKTKGHGLKHSFVLPGVIITVCSIGLSFLFSYLFLVCV